MRNQHRAFRLAFLLSFINALLLAQSIPAQSSAAGAQIKTERPPALLYSPLQPV